MENILEFIDFNNTGRSKKKCSKCGRADHTIRRCPTIACANCDQMEHVYSSCPTKIEERKRKRNRNAEQIEQHNFRNRADKRQRERHLTVNQTN